MKALIMFLAAVAIIILLFGGTAEACDRCVVAAEAHCPPTGVERIVGRFEVVERTTTIQKSYRVQPVAEPVYLLAPAPMPMSAAGYTAVEICHCCRLRAKFCRCVGKVLGVGRVAVGTVADASATTVRVVANAPVAFGYWAHRTADRFDAAWHEPRHRVVNTTK